jgi:hypothetical protein
VNVGEGVKKVGGKEVRGMSGNIHEYMERPGEEKEVKLTGYEGDETEHDDYGDKAMGKVISLIDKPRDITGIMGWCRKPECPFDYPGNEERSKRDEVREHPCHNSCFSVVDFVKSGITPEPMS